MISKEAQSAPMVLPPGCGPGFFYGKNMDCDVPLKESETHTDNTVAVMDGNKRIVIVGNGPVGMHLCNELMACVADSAVDFQIDIFGDEPWQPYNRVALSQLLYGEKSLEDLDLNIPNNSNIHTHWHTRISAIDPAHRSVMTDKGETFCYDKLVLATGSSAHIPNLPGVHMTGVYCFRNMTDVQALISRRVSSRRTVILGGGLLGIEAARAMRRLSTQVTLIHHSAWLMNRQLTENSAAKLQATLEQEGINVLTASGVQAVDGSRKMEGIILRDGSYLKCDTLILATGIRPNIQLAREAGLNTHHGIIVDDTLKTSDDFIYAVGECIEFNGEVYGLVAPGLEQASLLARRFSGQERKPYQQKSLATRLKVLDQPVTSLGEIGLLHEGPESRYLEHNREESHRVLHFERGQLKGAAAVGFWPDQERLQELLLNNESLPWWRSLRFRLTGRLWSDSDAIADHHIICNCRQVSAGQLRACAQQKLSLTSTGAGTVCGSCQPLFTQVIPKEQFNLSLAEPALQQAANEDTRSDSWLGLVMMGILALIIVALHLFMPALPIAQEYAFQSVSQWWSDSDYRQISGFTMLGLTAFGLLLSARKRLKKMTLGSFSDWRWLHLLLTSLCLIILLAHTGNSSIQGINAWLFYSFFSASILGCLLTWLTALEHAKPSVAVKRFKRWSLFTHILAIWPLPILLSFHILSVYWF